MRNSYFIFTAPTKPENLTSRGITGTTIELSWSEPESANGVIAGYRVYYMHSNYTDVKMHIPDKSTDSDDTNIDFVLKELSEYDRFLERGRSLAQPRIARANHTSAKEVQKIIKIIVFLYRISEQLSCCLTIVTFEGAKIRDFENSNFSSASF